MAWFKKRDRVVDLGVHYRKQQEKAAEMKAESEEASGTSSPSQEISSGGMFGFFGGSTPSTSSTERDTIDLTAPQTNPTLDANERKKKLAKRLMDITTKLEDLGNQIYHLQQRVELLEKKGRV